jgi:hypothetical protein
MVTRKKSQARDANAVMGQRTSPPMGSAAVVAWRRRRLERAGFPAHLARRLAADPRTDLHAVLDLIDRGCPPTLAARILAPLDGNPRQCNEPW